MRFQVKGVREPGAIVSLMIDAASGADAARLAEDQGLRVLALNRERNWSLRHLYARDAFPLLLFSQELTTLLNAGLALIDALESLAEKEPEGSARKVLQDLVRLLYEGKSFSQALTQFPSVFPALYVALVHSSEKTGGVGDALARYVTYRSRMDEVRQKIVSAAVYPVMLFLVGFGVLLFLVGYVVPRFSLVLEGIDTELPQLSRLLLSGGQFLSENQPAVYGGLLAAIIAAGLLLRRESVRQQLGALLQRIPSVHRRVFIYELARFYRSLGILLQGGIPLVTALEMVRGLLGATTRARLDRAALSIREGISLSTALDNNQLATPVSLRMLRAGERSGNVGEMMERTANFYDGEISRWIDWFVRLFEPLLMTFIGLIIGVIVVLMYIPIFELAASI